MAVAAPGTASPPGPEDDRFLGLALSLARRGLGRVWPNPAVGCVLVKDGQVIGRGWTQPGGRPHAETEALARAGAAARGATAYVSLEPCAHHGATGPCADALVRAGIARAVVAVEDPFPEVAGRGIARLREAGIDVAVGGRADEARRVNAGFFSRVERGRPLVTLKLATTLDGRIATRSGESRWITDTEARRQAHGLRARHDAVMVGSGTGLADDPRLTCELPGLEAWTPVRVVIDRRLRLTPVAATAVTARRHPTWLVTREDAPADRVAALRDAGVEVIGLPCDAPGTPDIGRVLRALADRGIGRLMVEGGARLAGSLLAARVVDRLEWFRAGSLIGDDGLAAVTGLAVERLAEQLAFERIAARGVGPDLWESLVATATG